MEITKVDATQYARLAAFLAVFEQRSFRGAATRLGTSASTLSRMVRLLEQDVGTRLLNRTTRSVAPTQAGEALYMRVSASVIDIEHAIRDAGLHRTLPRGVVRINLPRLAAGQAILPRLAAFAVAYPDIRLDLVIDDLLSDVVRDGFDAGIRSGALVDRDMIAVRMTPDLTTTVVGSPAYFSGRTLPNAPDDLHVHMCINYRWKETGVSPPWRFRGPGGPIAIKVSAAVSVNDSNLVLAAALAGVGLAQLPGSAVASHLERGELIGVLQPWCDSIPGFFLYYPSRTHLSAAFRAFIDFFKAR
ncbi:LysR family transcriptional regulator [Chitinasiproducens palmae]|uniref:LysR family transcriptional regulator n=1 Tax=Chitinasiproducens palmae TaxID=1770053 RepID=UPI001B8ABE48|nr:LysR family transcriptional regulator [Chitinasiproducens palmae]